MILLIYTFIPLPVYLCVIIGVGYSVLLEKFGATENSDLSVWGVKFLLHIGMHLLGIHLFILTQGTVWFYFFQRVELSELEIFYITVLA